MVSGFEQVNVVEFFGELRYEELFHPGRRVSGEEYFGIAVGDQQHDGRGIGFDYLRALRPEYVNMHIVK